MVIRIDGKRATADAGCSEPKGFPSLEGLKDGSMRQ